MPQISSFMDAATALWPAVGSAEARTVATRIGELTFEHGLPTAETAAKLFDELDFQRAVQAYIWALPIVSLVQAKIAQKRNIGAEDGDVAIYDGHRAVTVWLTANATTPYIIGFFDLAAHGPAVIDIPAGAIAGSAFDFWQRPFTDFGVTGPDQGKGGRYLVIGPGQDVPAGADDHIVVQSPTSNFGYFYRALDSDPAKAEAIATEVKAYPFSQRGDPRPTRYLRPPADGELDLAIQPRGLEYWRQLAGIIDHEPVEDRDRFFVAMLLPLGIEKGRPFQPNERQKRILAEAAVIGEAMARANSFDKRFPDARYRDDSHWDYLLMLDPVQDLANHSQLDRRAAYFYEAIATSKGMVSHTPGVGQAYLGSYRDRDGHAFDGAAHYRLRVPADPPARQFWSLTLYDLDTRVLIQNEQRIADRSSRMDLVTNADGSVDIHVGPTPPPGFERNWIPSVPGKAWFAYFRLYGPTEGYFDRSWPLPDFEKLG